MNDSFFSKEPYDSARDPSPAGDCAGNTNNAVPLQWDTFTSADEKRAKKTFSRYFLGLTFFSLSATAFIYILFYCILIPLGLREDPVVSSNLFVWLVEQVFSMYVLGFGVYYLFIRKMRVTPRAKTKLSLKNFLIFFCIAHAGMLIGALIGNTVNSLIESLCGWTITNNVSDMVAGTEFWLSFPIVALLGPFIEELLFRKFLIDRLSAYGDRIAIIVSAVAFGLFHGNFYQFFYAAILGLILGYLYTKTGNVLHTFAIHAIINGVSTLSVLLLPIEEKYLAYSQQLLENPSASLPAEFSLYSFIMGAYELYEFGLAILGIILFFKLRKRIFISDRCEVKIPKNRTASVVCLNPGGIVFILFSFIEILLSIFSPLLTG